MVLLNLELLSMPTSNCDALYSATSRSHNTMTMIESVEETLEVRQGGQDNEDVKYLV